MNKSCRGCVTYKYNDVNIDYTFSEETCRYHDYNDKSQCPCTECVVKMMCDVDCPVFTKFTDYIDAVIKDKGRP
jgi:hypothetical protein